MEIIKPNKEIRRLILELSDNEVHGIIKSLNNNPEFNYVINRRDCSYLIKYAFPHCTILKKTDDRNVTLFWTNVEDVKHKEMVFVYKSLVNQCISDISINEMTFDKLYMDFQNDTETTFFNTDCGDVILKTTGSKTGHNGVLTLSKYNKYNTKILYVYDKEIGGISGETIQIITK